MPEGNLIVGNKYKVFTRDKYNVISFLLGPFISSSLTETACVAYTRFNIIYYTLPTMWLHMLDLGLFLSIVSVLSDTEAQGRF